jgi:hypothetical protein
LGAKNDKKCDGRTRNDVPRAMKAEKAAIYEIQSICAPIEGKKGLLGVKYR